MFYVFKKFIGKDYCFYWIVKVVYCIKYLEIKIRGFGIVIIILIFSNIIFFYYFDLKYYILILYSELILINGS